MAPKTKQPKTLSGLGKDQVIFVARSLFGTNLDKSVRVDVLRDQLYQKMSETLEC